MTHCQNCGAEIAADAEICPDCGVNQTKPLEGAHGDRTVDEKYCVDCGELINKQAELCPECQAEQPDLRRGTDSDQTVAGILAILLGGLGAHKF